jgi:hypothetical protein
MCISGSTAFGPFGWRQYSYPGQMDKWGSAEVLAVNVETRSLSSKRKANWV